MHPHPENPTEEDAKTWLLNELKKSRFRILTELTKRLMDQGLDALYLAEYDRYLNHAQKILHEVETDWMWSIIKSNELESIYSRFEIEIREELQKKWEEQ